MGVHLSPLWQAAKPNGDKCTPFELNPLFCFTHPLKNYCM